MRKTIRKCPALFYCEMFEGFFIQYPNKKVEFYSVVQQDWAESAWTGYQDRLDTVNQLFEFITTL